MGQRGLAKHRANRVGYSLAFNPSGNLQSVGDQWDHMVGHFVQMLYFVSDFTELDFQLGAFFLQLAQA